MSCLSDTSYVQELREKVQTKDSAVVELKLTAGQLTPKLSQHDTDLVDGKIRESQARQSSLLSSIDQKLQGYGQLKTDLDTLRSQAQAYIDWLDECDARVKVGEDAGLSLGQLEARVEELKMLEQELGEMQSALEAVSDKTQALLADLPARERRDMETLLASVQTRHNELFGKVSEECRQREEVSDQVQQIQERMQQHRTWLQETRATTDQYDVIRLTAADVDKQLERCKSTVSRAQTRSDRLSEIRTKLAALDEIAGNTARKELDQSLEELSVQQESVVSRLREQQSNLRDCVDSRHKFETDCVKVDRWAADTELKCGTDQAGMQDPEQRLADLKNLSNAVHVFESLVKETTDLGESFFPSLYLEDHPLLTAQLQALQDKFLRASSVVESSTEQLESKLASQGQAQDQVTQCEQFLMAVQGEIKKAVRPIGFDAKDAELVQAVFKSLEEKLSTHTPTMDQLRESCERLREDGQVSLVDDITRLSDLHQTLADQVMAQIETCMSAVSQRQLFYQLLEAQEQIVSECETSMEAASNQPLEDRVQGYKNVLGKLQQLEPDLPIMAEKAAHIGTQGTEDDLATATAVVGKLTNKIHAQKASTQTQIAQCEALQREREGFETSINSLMTWLEEKESVLASCKELQLDSAKVLPVIAKHKTTSAEAQEKIKTIKDQAMAERSKFEAMSEPLPADVSDRLLQITALEESISSAISKKEQYLDSALTDRRQLENSMVQVTDWLHGASEILDSGVSGLDYDTLEGTLSEFTDYFTEASLCQDELDQVAELSEHLMPTLDSNDATTLEQSVAGVQRKFTQVMTGAHGRQGHLEQKLKQWNNFQEQLAAVSERLDVLEGEWQEVDHSADASVDAVQSHLELVKTFLEHAETSRSLVDSLNQVARDLERAGNQESCASIARHVQTVNERWEALTGQAEARVITLEEIGGQWGDFSTMLASVNTVVQESETRLAIVSLDDVTVTQMGQQLDNLKEIDANLERIQPQVSRLQTSSITLQKALPTAEAKITSQEQFLEIGERYERLVKQVKEITSTMQEEADARQSAIAELSQCFDWLTETLTSLQTYIDAGVTAEERLSRNKLCQAELKHQMEGLTALMTSLESLYRATGRDVPAEITDKLSEVQSLEKQVETILKEEEETLMQLREDRVEFLKLLADVTAWLRRADVQLQNRLVVLPQAREDHQVSGKEPQRVLLAF
ncbi:hypothetical protein RRG08_046298 [Elysia crispata]|uniref:Uncharacterized protein n=1 Tax=Elysia crispata TaxID=231223 RepID=A0AAE0YMW5_9GAST|nr:hypothetical protein RRG08_046298 [Elysia crispata]